MPSRGSSIVAPPLLQRRHHELQLQGRRPAPLKVSTTSTTAEMVIVNKKRRLHQHQQPVIIYVESPRVVHAHPAEFKSVVQRLTGAPPPVLFPSAPPPPQPLLPFQFPLVGVGAGSSAGAAQLLPLTSSSSSIMSVTTVANHATGCGSSSVVVQENLSSSDPFLPPLPSSVAAACYQYHGGDLCFIGHGHHHY